MSSCGYSDDLEPLALGRWRAQVSSALGGKRGQRLMVALEALVILEGEAKELQNRDGEGGRPVLAKVPLTRRDTEALPAAPTCGARASQQAAAADHADVVRPTAGIPNSKRAA